MPVILIVLSLLHYEMEAEAYNFDRLTDECPFVEQVFRENAFITIGSYLTKRNKHTSLEWSISQIYLNK